MIGQRIIRVAPALALIALTAIYLVTGYRTLDEESRQVPVITAWLTLLLLGLDLVASWRSGAAGKSGNEEEEIVALSDEIRAVLSLLALVVAIWFLGFYAGGVLYLLVALWWIGKQTLRLSIVTTVIAFVCIYLLFEKALAFQLFRGVLFPG